ncbi:putative sulfite reductase (NADPH) flavoprotein [Chlamydiales bacterium STE3]|nr:putative sulfite reductase (NADPH) flavoprotein [Chlamydiales bacterium STE3]
MNKQETYNKIHPFLATIKERTLLCKAGSQKCTYHIVLDIQGSGLRYNVGDSLGVFPLNNLNLIEKTLIAAKASGEEVVVDRNGEEISFRNFLHSKANITEFSKKFISVVLERQSLPFKRKILENLLQEDNREQLKQYMEDRELWEVLHENEEVTFTAQELSSLLMPLLPRLYSISSSQLVVGDEVHLTIALTRYQTLGIERQGVCTHYLCCDCPIGEPVVPIYIQPHHGFTLPESEEAPIIMVGPGTGIAPFRAFLQERLHKKHVGKNWLFFGEWTKNGEYFYEEEWLKLEGEGQLKLHLAFSRDQATKIYVQHRMLENGLEIFQWLEQGAYLFVCGDAKYMAKDVELALIEIIKQYGHLDNDQAKLYLKRLRAEKRYLRDVY